jgi:hypothetical protein
MKVWFAWTALLAVSLGGCSSSSSSSNAAATCGKVAPCGGNLVGTWKFVAECDGADSQQNHCAGGTTAQDLETVTQSVIVSGTVTFNADMTYSIAKDTSDTITVMEPAECLGFAETCDQLARTMGPPELVTCADAGNGCKCTQHPGDVTSYSTGSYTVVREQVLSTSGSSGSALGYNYCVQGDTLHLLGNNGYDQVAVK